MPTQRLWPRGRIRVELIDQPITELEPNDVVVFGSNATGFHGAGAAGLACRGTARNDWREDAWLTTARDAPVGSPARIGTWAVFGKARGPQRGTEGMSYAIETIQTPGKLRSTSLRDISRACPPDRKPHPPKSCLRKIPSNPPSSPRSWQPSWPTHPPLAKRSGNPEPGLGGYSTFVFRKGFFSLAGNNLHPMWHAFLASFPDEEAKSEACEYATFATDTIVTIVSYNDGDTELWICHEGSGKIVVNSDAAGTDWKWGLPE